MVQAKTEKGESKKREKGVKKEKRRACARLFLEAFGFSLLSMVRLQSK